MPRILVVISLLLLAPACADSASDGHPRILLPRVGAVGATPAELGLEQVVVTVTVDGRIITADGEKDPAALVGWLTPHANRSRDESSPMLPSRVHLLVRADAGAPWSAVQGVLRAAADSDNRVIRVLFAVRQELTRDLVEGAFAYFLPTSHRPALVPASAKPAVVTVKRSETVGFVLTMVDWLYRAGYRPWVAVGDEPDLLVVTDDDEWRSVSPAEITGPWTPPGRSQEMTGNAAPWKMPEPVLEDPVERDD